ncbi:MAG: Flp pilus assembly complex ATPase component TadA [Defluviitaleaceae bacterium]|nr:Flp pilus assembly complex ATPase component TadA [Defluviitaleaceae bacterium]
MLNVGKIRELQERFINEKSVAELSEADGGLIISSMLSFDDAVKNCQTYIANKASAGFREERDESLKIKLMRDYINEFVDEQMNEGKLRVQRPRSREAYGWDELKIALINEITNYGPITRAVEDDRIDEIRGNGPKTIFVESGGRTTQWDNTFYDTEHMERIISKLINVSKLRLTPKNPMVNARMVEGYRVNATHAGISPYNEPAFVLRKFSKKKITPEDMISSKSFSRNMYTLLSIIPKADLSWITVGGTGSGKTTLNELMVKEIDPLSRIITIENPSEMRLRKFDRGKIINDVLQYESTSEDDDSSPATMENLLINAMRQSPHWIGPGELRTPGEFATALRAAQTGHYFFTTLHAEGDEEAIYRFLTSYLMISHEPAELALRNICSAVKFIIYQEKLADGTRKVTSISEVLGAEGLKPVINRLYTFECIDVVDDPITQKVVKIIGRHKRVGVLSEANRQNILKAGIKKDKFDFLTNPPSENEAEEYIE